MPFSLAKRCFSYFRLTAELLDVFFHHGILHNPPFCIETWWNMGELRFFFRWNKVAEINIWILVITPLFLRFRIKKGVGGRGRGTKRKKRKAFSFSNSRRFNQINRQNNTLLQWMAFQTAYSCITVQFNIFISSVEWPPASNWRLCHCYGSGSKKQQQKPLLFVNKHWVLSVPLHITLSVFMSLTRPVWLL